MQFLLQIALKYVRILITNSKLIKMLTSPTFRRNDIHMSKRKLMMVIFSFHQLSLNIKSS